MTDHHRASDFIEILAPIADASKALADCIQDNRSGLAGASIAISESGTLLLNPVAWRLCGETLRALPGFKAREPASDVSQPLRFLLTASQSPEGDPP
jgi:hypothetical protein